MSKWYCICKYLIVELHFDLKQKQQKAKILIIPGSGVGWGTCPWTKTSMVRTVLDQG